MGRARVALRPEKQAEATLDTQGLGHSKIVFCFWLLPGIYRQRAAQIFKRQQAETTTQRSESPSKIEGPFEFSLAPLA